MSTVDEVRVLVVDDTDDIRFLLKLAFDLEDGFTVVGEARDGITAVEEARRLRPELILLDLAMPRMDGLEALPLIRVLVPDATIIVLSGFERATLGPQVRAAGADEFLQKGVEPQRIVDRARELCGRPGAPPVSAGPPTGAGQPAGLELVADPPEAERLRRAIASAAHEIRNPVTVLAGAAQTLATNRDRLTPEVQDRLLFAIRHQAYVLERTTADLLAAAQGHVGSLAVQVRDVEVGPLLEACVRAHPQTSEVSVSCPPGLVACADPGRLDQMVANLLSNAVKYGAPPLALTAARLDSDGVALGDAVEIRVSDGGHGVSAEFEAVMFEEFTREPGRDGSGTGLGLHVVRQLARAQGGEVGYGVGVDGRPEFRIVLPAAPAAAPERAPMLVDGGLG